MEIYLSGFLALALAHFVALLSPGVDFFLILSNASKYGRSSGVVTSAGIATGNLVYIVLALFGITLIKENELVFASLKILGSLYLLYIGYMLLRVKKRELFSNQTEEKRGKKETIKYFSMGFLSAILNPKNSIFYLTMFTISIQNDTPFYVQSFYAAWMFFAVLFWDIFVVYLVTNSKSRIWVDRYSNHIEKVSGAILLFLGSSILVDSVLY